jgi:diacylglycerol kinase (ATP)
VFGLLDLGGNLKVGVIVNPVAGGGRMARMWPGFEAALRHRLGPLEVAFTTRQGEGRALAAQLVGDGVDLLIAAGGDGTVGEIVDGLLSQGEAARSVELGIAPVGTGADLARTLKLRVDASAIAARIADSPARPVDAGLIECVGDDGRPVIRHFINIASIGISADIAFAVNASAKRLLPGKLLFAWHTLKELARLQAPHLVLRVDGKEVFCGASPLVAVANNHSFAGGMRIAPDALMDDGVFDVVTVRDAGRLSLIRALRRVYDGSHRNLDICSFARGRHIEVETPAGRVGLEADGETTGFLPARISILAGAIRLRA